MNFDQSVLFKWEGDGTMRCENDRAAFHLFVATVNGSPLSIATDAKGEYVDEYTRLAWKAWRISNELRIRDDSAAIASEREACAKVVDTTDPLKAICDWEDADDIAFAVQRHYAAAIRARGAS